MKAFALKAALTIGTVITECTVVMTISAHIPAKTILNVIPTVAKEASAQTQATVE
jgi:hypothetical protein